MKRPPQIVKTLLEMLAIDGASYTNIDSALHVRPGSDGISGLLEMINEQA
jgi:hypothetical protein